MKDRLFDHLARTLGCITLSALVSCAEQPNTAPLVDLTIGTNKVTRGKDSCYDAHYTITLPNGLWGHSVVKIVRVVLDKETKQEIEVPLFVFGSDPQTDIALSNGSITRFTQIPTPSGLEFFRQKIRAYDQNGYLVNEDQDIAVIGCIPTAVIPK